MDYSGFRSYANWRADNALSQAQIPALLRKLVSDKGSLTSALINLGDGDFAVRVLSQGIAVPSFHEQLKLQRPLSRAAMVREVELIVKGRTIVFARSVIPLALVLEGRSGLANLGRTPLGHLLFKDGRIRVSKREFAQIDNAASDQSLSADAKKIVARRTPYDYMGSRILVSEFFLPALTALLDQ